MTVPFLFESMRVLTVGSEQRYWLIEMFFISKNLGWSREEVWQVPRRERRFWYDLCCKMMKYTKGL